MRGKACLPEQRPEREGGGRQQHEDAEPAKRPLALGRQPHTHAEGDEQHAVEQSLPRLKNAFVGLPARCISLMALETRL